jgi:hypothetical protein
MFQWIRMKIKPEPERPATVSICPVVCIDWHEMPCTDFTVQIQKLKFANVIKKNSHRVP